MISHEMHGDEHVVTILDDSGRDADLEIHFKDYGNSITLRQTWDDMNSDVLVLTPLQSIALKDLLAAILIEELDS